MIKFIPRFRPLKYTENGVLVTLDMWDEVNNIPAGKEYYGPINIEKIVLSKDYRLHFTPFQRLKELGLVFNFNTKYFKNGYVRFKITKDIILKDEQPIGFLKILKNKKRRPEIKSYEKRREKDIQLKVQKTNEKVNCKLGPVEE